MVWGTSRATVWASCVRMGAIWERLGVSCGVSWRGHAAILGRWGNLGEFNGALEAFWERLAAPWVAGPFET